MNRGSDTGHAQHLLSPARFNEAPIHESGKCPATADKPDPWPSFNEAPIHESGKSCFSFANSIMFLRFNEAPIHESGK